MNIFQHLVLSILFINKHIFGEHNSDISLPLPFSCQQLAKQVHLGSKFSLLNVPSQAVTYWVHGKNYKKGDGGNCPCNDTIRVSALKDDSDELYVTLEKKQNEICATRQLIKLKGDHRCTNEDLAKYSHKTHDYRSNGFSERGVVFNVDWQKRCELIVGSEQVFKCNHGGDGNSTIQWYQEFNHGNVNPVPIGDRSTITMRIDDLDENTAFVCYQKVGQFGKSKEIVRYPIKISTLNSSRIIPRYYNETSEIRYSCEKNPEHEGYTLVMLIQNKVFKNITQYSGPVQLKLKEEDSGSIFSCVNIIQKPLEIERNISKKEMFIFKREPHVRDLSTTTRHVTIVCSGTLEEFDDDTIFTCVMSQNPLNNQTHTINCRLL
ncbi:unnamed protein product [Arctia plantaginis]|uniref:Uncharacterized protein n=1 Tax=Arctia plantaginis TaxID=874455 RepID=A0A8S0ZSF1_ARCPL|nr:unnamed protein product [Arctia plantaginis]